MYSSASGAWTNRDGSLVATVATIRIASEHGNEGDAHQGISILSWTKDSGVEEPPWWGLGEDEIKARVETWLAEFDGYENEPPLALVFSKEADDLKLVNDVIDAFQKRMGDPASIVQPR